MYWASLKQWYFGCELRELRGKSLIFVAATDNLKVENVLMSKNV